MLVNKLKQIALARVSSLRRDDQELNRLLMSIETLGEVVVIGGALRDWLFGHEPRDLDLVVDVRHSVLAEVLDPLAERRTRYGGYHLRVGGCRVDVWSLDATWAFRSSATKREPNFANLPATAFFNLDAVAWRISDGQVFECGFVEGVEQRVLSIVFEQNPFPALCAVRALLLAKKYGLSLDSGVVEYFDRLVQFGIAWDELNEAQLSHYGAVRVTPDDVLELVPPHLADKILRSVALSSSCRSSE
jgi:hypothetical protein